MPMNRVLFTLLCLRSATASISPTTSQFKSQSLPTSFYGQHVGVAYADLNNDGALDLLFASGRHWVDQSYALINLGVLGSGDGDDNEFEGVRFSDPLPIGPPGSYYQIDVATYSTVEDISVSTMQHRVLLVGGTCHYPEPNDFGSCVKGENTPARVLAVNLSSDEDGGCSVQHPDRPCHLSWEEIWVHPNPKGDRNGGFALFEEDGESNDNSLNFRGKNEPAIVLLGQGGVEIFSPFYSDALTYNMTYQLIPPEKTDPRSDFARYAGFAAGILPNFGGVIAAGRRTDYDLPEKDENGNYVGINKMVYWNQEDNSFDLISSSCGESDDDDEILESSSGDAIGHTHCSPISSLVTGEPYPGNVSYSIQSTNFAFADINGDGVQDLLEATYLYPHQIVPGYPLPQRIHFLNPNAQVKETKVIFNNEHGGRSVTTGQVFGDSELPDVVFASAQGKVTLFANLGMDEGEDGTKKWRGLERRGEELSIGDDRCQIRDVEVVPLVNGGADKLHRFGDDRGNPEECWVGIVCAVACKQKPPRVIGKNHIFYVKGSRSSCLDNGLENYDIKID